MDWPKKSEIYLMHVIEMKDAPPIMPSGGPSSWDRVIAQARGQLVTAARLFLEQTKKDMLKHCLAMHCQMSLVRLLITRPGD